MKCHKCNAEMGSEDVFCGECGASVPKAAAEVKVETEVKAETTCPSCGAEMNAGEVFCGECGHQIKSEQIEKAERSGNEYPLVPMALTAALIFILLFIQSQLESSGLFDDWVTTENFRFFAIVVGCIIASITGIAVGLYIIIKSVKMLDRKFHSFSIFFLISLVVFLATEALIVIFGPWEYIDAAFSITSAALFSVVTSLIIIGVSSLSSREMGGQA